MHHFDPPPPPPLRRREMTIWAVCAALLIVPSVLVWIVRAAALGFSCTPGPALCHGLPFGEVFHDVLRLAWFVASDTLFTIGIAFVASVAALFARRPLMAALTMLVLPIAALALPTFAVLSALYADCIPSEAGAGDCLLWGTQMGMSVNNAAKAEWIIYGMAPYTFSLALMIGAIGFLCFRPLKT